MKINELQVKQGKVELQAKVTDKGEAREFQKFGKSGRVCNATLTDDTGDIKLTLWNDQIDTIEVGDTVKIEGGYVGEYQGEKQLTSGKFGKLEVVSKGDGAPAEEAPKKGKKPAQPDEEMVE